jgi:peroxiredoxin
MRNANHRFPRSLLTAILFCVSAAVSAAPTVRPAATFDLKAYQGKVLLLEIGVIGCEKSQEGLAALQKIRGAARNDKDLAIAFVHASPNEAALKEFLGKGNYEFDVFSDTQGKIARLFSFQAIPTFYLIGKEGDIRYAGPRDEKKLAEMLAAIRAEKPGSKKNYFLDERTAPGAKIIPFALKSNGNAEVSTTATLKGAKLLLLLFGDDKCPFSRDALAKLPTLDRRFSSGGLKTLVVHVGAWNAQAASYYSGLKLPCPVALDENEKLADAYAVKAVPTVLLVRPDGVIHAKALYSPETDKMIETYLKGGTAAATPTPAPKNAGAGKG